MANKLFNTLSILAATFLAAGVHAQDPSCPPNSSLCGHALLDTFNCIDPITLGLTTPQGNDARDCIFKVDGFGVPLGGGVMCCSVGRCFVNGLTSECN